MLLLLFIGHTDAAKYTPWPPMIELDDWEREDWPPEHFHNDDEALIILNQ